jgi:cardiolipin synthase A/B
MVTKQPPSDEHATRPRSPVHDHPTMTQRPSKDIGQRSRWIDALVLAAAACLAVAACSTLPSRDTAAVSRAAASPRALTEVGRVTVHGAQGPVSAAQEDRALAQVAAEGKTDLLAHHLEVLSAGGDVDLHRGNRTRLLVDGPATFAAMKAAIAAARSRVLLESYIVEDQGVAAEIAELLLAKAAQGVRVALLYDAVGSLSTPETFFQRLADGGVAVCAFNPIDPTHRPGHWGINHRDHRKLLVTDNTAAFTGGINISRVYGSGSFGSRAKVKAGKAGDADALKDGWRDTQIEMRGPVVPALANVFATTWREQGCRGELAALQATSAPSEPGQRLVKVIASDPRDQSNRIYDTLIKAVDASQRNVRLTMAYFAPGAEFVQALADAARRGVTVELVLPGRSDFTLMLHAGRSYYGQLLDAGVRLHEVEHAMMHAKTAVIDDVLATVGSSNLDWRSIVDNNELNVIVLGEDFGAEMKALFERDRQASREVTLAQWRQRGIGRRALETVGRIAERWL